ncbi:MAG: hypothetical protein CMM02_05340 [Rhodopirellula sp.]|jgi:hypothetical protein|nr:hypothetical protein [Rhodopirellula sp.]
MIEPERNIPETDFADQLGLPREELARIRKGDNYLLGHHWDKDGAKIVWLPRGKELLREELGLTTGPKIGDKAAGRVIADYCPNQRIIRMIINDEKEDVQCDPMDKPLLKSPMTVPVQYSAAGWRVARSPRL